jgi:RNA polymerase sigma-70 factor (ECF subfamily)
MAADSNFSVVIVNAQALLYNSSVAVMSPNLSDGLAQEQKLLYALRRGDETAFRELVSQYHGAMVRIAQMYVRDQDTAQEVAQEAWLGILRGLDGFEGRSSLKTWIFTIVSNLAKTRGTRERRTVAFSELARAEVEADDPAVSPDRFQPEGAADPGWWVSYPPQWRMGVEEQFLAREQMRYLEDAIEQLPAAQRTVIVLRDIEGWSAEEVCNVLELAETNQRVLLHRARAKVRTALAQYLGREPAP